MSSHVPSDPVQPDQTNEDSLTELPDRRIEQHHLWLGPIPKIGSFLFCKAFMEYFGALFLKCKQWKGWPRDTTRLDGRLAFHLGLRPGDLRGVANQKGHEDGAGRPKIARHYARPTCDVSASPNYTKVIDVLEQVLTWTLQFLCGVLSSNREAGISK